jgi:hypothetical protein
VIADLRKCNCEALSLNDLHTRVVIQEILEGYVVGV